MYMISDEDICGISSDSIKHHIETLSDKDARQIVRWIDRNHFEVDIRTVYRGAGKKNNGA